MDVYNRKLKLLDILAMQWGVVDSHGDVGIVILNHYKPCMVLICILSRIGKLLTSKLFVERRGKLNLVVYILPGLILN